MRENLTETLHKAKFFSLQMDGSTDCANIEEELLLTPIPLSVLYR